MTEGNRAAGSPSELGAGLESHVFCADGQNVAEAIVEAVAEVNRTDPLSLPPIFGVVDPDALEALVGDTSDDRALDVSFEYAGRQVTVHRGGRIEVV